MAVVREAYATQPDGSRGATSVLLVAPTGAGKGTLAAYALSQAAQKGSRSLFIVHRREIIRDVHKRLRAVGAPASMILAGERYNPDAPIQVCSIDTLGARSLRPKADFVFWDEAHHCVARTYCKLREAYPNARHLGATATPMRADKTALGDVFQKMLVIAKPSELIEKGWLVPCSIVTPGINLDRNLAQGIVDAYQAHGQKKRAFVFVERKTIAHQIAQEFNDAKIPAAAIDGDTADFVRTKMISMFAAGHIRVIVNVGTMTEGVDVPQAKVCILASKNATVAVYLQRVGRVLRPAEGEGDAILIDLCGNSSVHGHPSDDRRMSLEGKPIRFAPRPGEEIPCPGKGIYRNSCDEKLSEEEAAWNGPGCPKCGWKKRKPIEREPLPPQEVLGVPLHEVPHDEAVGMAAAE